MLQAGASAQQTSPCQVKGLPMGLRSEAGLPTWTVTLTQIRPSASTHEPCWPVTAARSPKLSQPLA